MPALKNKLRYYPSFPFGNLHLDFLRKKFKDFEWVHKAADIAVIDSNAAQFVDRLDESHILLINPIIKKLGANEPLPIYFKNKWMLKAYLKRSQKYKLNLFLEAYSYPNHFPTALKRQAKEILADFDNWHKLISLKYSIKDQSRLLTSKNYLFLDNPEDSLRSKEDTSYLKQYIKCDLPHGLLAFNSKDIDFLNQKLHDLRQMQ